MVHSMKNHCTPGPSRKSEKVHPTAPPARATSDQSKPPISKSSLKRKSTAPPHVKPKKQKSDTTIYYEKIMEGVIFAISGYVNPDRARIRDAALKMGAKYERDINTNVTHLICAVANTPKYNQFLGRGKIMKKEWIFLQSETKKVRRLFMIKDGSGQISQNRVSGNQFTVEGSLFRKRPLIFYDFRFLKLQNKGLTLYTIRKNLGGESKNLYL